MFTGLIEEIGSIKSIVPVGQTLRGEFICSLVLENTRIGDSIAINGVCQTVTAVTKNSFTVEISSTTLRKTTISEWQNMKYVNLERAMRLEDRLGGHFVQGHVNNTAGIIKIVESESMILLELQLGQEDMKYIIDEGSISVDGISLTVSEKNRKQNMISIRVIPHTFRGTTLKYRKAGDRVNIETDMIGRYIESLITGGKEEKLTIKELRSWGY